MVHIVWRVKIGLTNSEAYNIMACGTQVTGLLRHADDGTLIGRAGSGNEERSRIKLCHALRYAMPDLPRRDITGIRSAMKKLILIGSGLALLAACTTKSKIEITHVAPSVQTKSRSEPIFYNGKNYQLDYSFNESQRVFDMNVSGLGPKQQKDATNIATSSLAYYACPDGQRGRLIGAPTYIGGKWALQAKCG